MQIDLWKIFKKNKISNYLAGQQIFNIVKKHVDQTPNDFQIILNFEKIVVFTQIPFKTLISSMKSRLDGNYTIKLVNQNKLIEKSFKNSL